MRCLSIVIIVMLFSHPMWLVGQASASRMVSPVGMAEADDLLPDVLPDETLLPPVDLMLDELGELSAFVIGQPYLLPTPSNADANAIVEAVANELMASPYRQLWIWAADPAQQLRAATWLRAAGAPNAQLVAVVEPLSLHPDARGKILIELR